MHDVLARLLGPLRSAMPAIVGIIGAIVLVGCGGAADGTDPVAAEVTTEQEATPDETTAPPPEEEAGGEAVLDVTATPSEVAGSTDVAPDPVETELARPAGVPGDAQPAVVERIVDGDTFWVRVDQADSGPLAAAATHKIRLLEYDSPEATSSTECFGPEATQRLTELTPVGSEVWLEADVEDTDRYGRFLRYVWLTDGRMVNLVMVEEGFGEAILYQPNDRHIDLLRAAEEGARAADSGMWGQPCDYDAPPPPPEPEPDEGAGTDGPETDGDASNPWGSSSCDPAYDPCVPPKSEVGDLNCPDIREKYPSGVKVDHTHGDAHGLDRDEDGHGCE